MSDFGRESLRPVGESKDMPTEREIAEETWDEGLRAAFVPDLREAALPASYGRLQVLGELGRGGIGVVLRAYDPDLRREVAIKVLHDRYSDDPALVQRFIAEAQLAGQLEHPGIVPVHSVGVDSRGRPFFLMKIVAGETLHTILEREKAMPGAPARLLQIFLKVCQTVAYAQARGVVHRDLKPANVMVGAFGEVQVMDWGFAKVLGHDDPFATAVATLSSELGGELSRPGAAMGTPGFMAPEQARGERDRIDARTDVYALGAILRLILAIDPEPDGELLALAARCTEETQAARPLDAGVVAQAVSGWLDGMAERTTRARVAAAAAESRAIGERKSRRLTLALSVAVFAVGALALTWFFVASAEAEKSRERRDHDLAMRVLRGRSQPPGMPRAVRDLRDGFTRAGIDLDTLALNELGKLLIEKQISVTTDVARGLEELAARGDTTRDWLAGSDAVDSDGLRHRIRGLWRARETEKLRTLAQDLKASPPEPATAVLLAHALTVSGKDQDAVALLESAAEEYPRDLWVRVKLVHVYLRRGPPSRAEMERQISQAKKLHPDPEWEPNPPPPPSQPPPRRGG